MPSLRPEVTEPNFLILAYVIVDEQVEFITLDYANQMKLPFDEGWEGWVVYQSETKEPIYGSDDYLSVAQVCVALNNPIL